MPATALSGKNTKRPASPSAPYCRFGELGFGKSVIFFRILNTPHLRFVGEAQNIFSRTRRHRLSLLAKPAKNANIATIKDISLPPLAFSSSSHFECDNACHILERFSKKFKKFATLYQKCRIEKVFEIYPLTKPSIRVRLKMRTAKKEILVFCSLLQNAVRLLATLSALLFHIYSLPSSTCRRAKTRRFGFVSMMDRHFPPPTAVLQQLPEEINCFCDFGAKNKIPSPRKGSFDFGH